MAKPKRGRVTGTVVTTHIPSPAGGVRIETYIPWTLVKCGARREVITPIDAPTAFQDEVRTDNEQRKRDQHSPLLRSLGLAHYWQQLLDDGRFRSLTEMAAAEGMDVGRVSRIIRLAQLSPEIVTACLGASADRETLLAAARHAAPLDWTLQRLAGRSWYP